MPAASPPKKLTPARRQHIEERIALARLTVNCYCRFFGHLIGKTVTVVAEPHHGVPTAAISPDGYMYFNPDYVDSLKDEELAGLVVHETLHVALLCWKRQGNRTALLRLPDGQIVGAWNLAHDYSFNGEILELAETCRSKGKIRLPKYAALDYRFQGLSAEQIYDILLEEAEEAPEHGIAGVLASMPGGMQEGKSGIGDDLRDDLSQSEVGKAAAGGCEASQANLDNKWRIAVIAAAMAHEKGHERGTLPLGISLLVNELTEHKVDWRDVLSQWLGENGNREDITMRRPRRRFDSNVLYLPSFQKFGVDDVWVLWDTSGSMGGRETEILSEIQGMCEDLGLKLRIICIDTQIHTITDDVSKAEDMIGKIKGGGGSNFCPAFTLAEEECFDGVIVAFTDGFITVPKTKPPLVRDVLWCIKPTSEGGYGDVDPTDGRWGQVLLMEDQR